MTNEIRPSIFDPENYPEDQISNEQEKIAVYKITFDEAFYYDTQFPFDPEVGTIVEGVILDREYYESLPEFQGF
jgi:hypothetical protein